MRVRRQRSALALSGLGGGLVESTRGELAVARAYWVSVGGGSVTMKWQLVDGIQ